MLLIYANYFYIPPPEEEPSIDDIVAMLNVQTYEMIEEKQEEPEPIKKEKKKNPSSTEKKSSKKENNKIDKKDNSKVKAADKKIETIDDALEELDGMTEVLANPDFGNTDFLKKYENKDLDLEIANTDYTVTKEPGLKIATSNTKALDTTPSDIKINKAKISHGKINISKGPKVKIRKRKPTTIKDNKKIKISDKKCSIDIKKIVKKKKGNIGYCYDRLVKSNPEAGGRLDLTIKIQNTANKVTIEKGSIKNKDFHRCIKRKIKKWKFPDSCVNVIFKKTYILTTDK